MKISKGSFNIYNSDGTKMELGFVLPFEIAEKIAIQIISWKEDWVDTTKTVEDYQNSEKEFIEKLKK
jgi:hypothetical protein